MADLRDEYGNPIRRQTGEYGGNPISSTTGYGAGGHEVGFGAAAHPAGGAMPPGAGGPTRMKGLQHRSGSSSSSSSEDDGAGGRRKKKLGLKEKIKEKLPGQRSSTEQQPQPQHGGVGYAQPTTTHQHEPAEKKGMMEKIKEKLPGGQQ